MVPTENRTKRIQYGQRGSSRIISIKDKAAIKIKLEKMSRSTDREAEENLLKRNSFHFQIEYKQMLDAAQEIKSFSFIIAAGDPISLTLLTEAIKTGIAN